MTMLGTKKYDQHSQIQKKTNFQNVPVAFCKESVNSLINQI